MRIADALNILGLEGTADSDSCETAYRRAAMKFHPDRNPAGADMMKACNAAIESIRKWYADGNDELRPHTNPSGYGDLLNEALNALNGLDGLDIEICGSWIWVGGNTKAHKETIKAAGYKWGRNKSRWYFRPEGYQKRHKGSWSMDKIRDHHGSEHYNNNRGDDDKPRGNPQQIRGAA